jgi:hypothetical protein
MRVTTDLKLSRSHVAVERDTIQREDWILEITLNDDGDELSLWADSLSDLAALGAAILEAVKDATP